MRLSDAIALGRTTVPEWIATKLEGCALGMAGNAAGLKHWWNPDSAFNYVDLEMAWPWLKQPVERCHLCGVNVKTNLLLIAHIFDIHVVETHCHPAWTLDQLIDWVRTIEPAEEQEKQLEATEQHQEVPVRSHP